MAMWHQIERMNHLGERQGQPWTYTSAKGNQHAEFTALTRASTGGLVKARLRHKAHHNDLFTKHAHRPEPPFKKKDWKGLLRRYGAGVFAEHWAG